MRCKSSAKSRSLCAKGEKAGRVHSFPNPKDVRKRAKLTQKQMAPLMGMSLSGYRKWEQGQRTVNGPAANLLKVMEADPKAVIKALR